MEILAITITRITCMRSAWGNTSVERRTVIGICIISVMQRMHLCLTVRGFTQRVFYGEGKCIFFKCIYIKRNMADLENTTEPPESEEPSEPVPFLKPKPKRQISEEHRKMLSERMKRVNQERIDRAREARKSELDLKEQRKLDELERIRERKALADVSVRETKKARETLKREAEERGELPKVETKPKAKPTPKAKSPKVIYESESESDDYETRQDDDEDDESEEEVLIVKKKRQPKAEQPILKQKGKAVKSPEVVAKKVEPPKPMVRFI